MVADLDGEGAERVAAEIGDAALAVACDVTDPGHADAVVGAAESAFGPVDLYCANAGIAIGADMATPAEWDRAFGVNVRAHIVAAERLLPGWLERGHGYFLTTASAAGIVSQIGSAPYAVTKHAAVAFAEWLSITYGDRGVGVSLPVPDGRQDADDRRVRQHRRARRQGGPATCSSRRRSPTSSSRACATGAS